MASRVWRRFGIYWQLFFRVGVITGGFFIFSVLRSRSILDVSIIAGLAGLALFKSLVTERELRYIWCALLPLAIGISLANYPVANPLLAILGGAVSLVFGLWLYLLRYPFQFRAGSKAVQS